MGMFKISIRVVALFCSLMLAGRAWSLPSKVECPVKAGLNECVAEACQNPEGGTVYLKAGQYNANITTAVNIEGSGVGLCPGGVSILGKGIDKTILISSGTNPNPGTVGPQNLPWALAIGSPLGSISGDIEVRDLTIRCTASAPCPTYAMGAIGATSATIENIRTQGFVRGIVSASDDNVIAGNIVEGQGEDNPTSRGIFLAHPFSERLSGGRIENNVVSKVFRAMVADTAKEVVITRNTLHAVAQGIFTQNIQDSMEITKNLLIGADLAIAMNLDVYEPDDEGNLVSVGATPAALIARNVFLDDATAVGLSFSAFETHVTLLKNLILGSDAALVFDPNANPPNFPPSDPGFPYDPCLHQIDLIGNVIAPPGATIPDLGSCDD